MTHSDKLKKFREELCGWKLTALRLTANGRFKGYEPAFRTWLADVSGTLKGKAARTTMTALHEFNEAMRRVEAENDELFPEICDRLERTLILAEEVVYDLSKEDYEAFNEICAEEKVDPNEKITEFIRVYIVQRRKHLPGLQKEPH